MFKRITNRYVPVQLVRRYVTIREDILNIRMKGRTK